MNERDIIKIKHEIPEEPKCQSEEFWMGFIKNVEEHPFNDDYLKRMSKNDVKYFLIRFLSKYYNYVDDEKNKTLINGLFEEDWNKWENDKKREEERIKRENDKKKEEEWIEDDNEECSNEEQPEAGDKKNKEEN